MKIELVSLSYCGMKRILQLDSNIEKLFILVKCVNGDLFDFKEDQLLKQLDPNKIVFVLIKQGIFSDDIQMPSSILSKFKVINIDETYVNDTHNFMCGTNWPRCKRNDRINVVLLFSKWDLRKLRGVKPEIAITPKLYDSSRTLSNDCGMVAVTCTCLPGPTNQYLELDDSTVTIYN